mmetsp:Transcript_41105/g.114259  ORF Transcript_41105/g.114259 Transcript_41105/m.114259 type:complete len:265 (+) Transcript_41105:301-1095(+)
MVKPLAPLGGVAAQHALELLGLNQLLSSHAAKDAGGKGISLWVRALLTPRLGGVGRSGGLAGRNGRGRRRRGGRCCQGQAPRQGLPHGLLHWQEFVHVQVALVLRAERPQERMILGHVPELPVVVDGAHCVLARHGKISRVPIRQLFLGDSSSSCIVHKVEEVLNGGCVRAEGVVNGIERLLATAVGALLSGPATHDSATRATDEMLARAPLLPMVIPQGKAVGVKWFAALLALPGGQGLMLRSRHGESDWGWLQHVTSVQSCQ